MAEVVVLGSTAGTVGFGLAGALLVEADDPEQVRTQWARLSGTVAVVVLTPQAAAALGPEVLEATAGPLTVVLPE